MKGNTHLFVCVIYLQMNHCVYSVMFNSLWPYGQAPLSMGFFRQGCWSELLFPPPHEGLQRVGCYFLFLLKKIPGIKLVSPISPALQADSLPAEPKGAHPCQITSSVMSNSL